MVGISFSENSRLKYISRTDKKLSRKENSVVKMTENKKEKKQWSTKKKVAFWILVAAALAAVIFVVCVFVFDLGPVRPIESSEEDARVVGSCAGFEIRYEELRYVTLMHRASLDREMGKYQELDEQGKAIYEEELKLRVSKDLRNNYAVLTLCQKYGIDIDSKEAKNYVNDSISSFVDELGGKKAYRTWLEENNLTDAFLRLMYKVAYLETALVDKLTLEKEQIKYSTANLDDFVAYMMEDESYVKVIHAYYPYDFEYKDGKSAKEAAYEALDTILGEEDDEERLELMRSAIGRAPFVPGYSTTGNDYYITLGQMHQNYEDVAFSLSEYEVSSVLELDEGCYILMRVPKVRDEVAPRAYELIDQYRYAVVKRMIDEQKELIKFEADRLYVTLTLAEID